MDNTTIFIAGMIAIVITSLLVIGYIKSPMKKILVDICGTEDRATFWVTFTNIMIILPPVLFAMNCQPNIAKSGSVFFEMVTQYKWGLFGLTGAVLVVGITIWASIDTNNSKKTELRDKPRGATTTTTS